MVNDNLIVFKEEIPLEEQKKVCEEIETVPINSDYSYFHKLLILLGPIPKERQKIDLDKVIIFKSDNFKNAQLSVKFTTLNITDFIVLSYLNELIKKNKSRVISTSLYDIANHVFSISGGDKYKIIRDSLMSLKYSNMMLSWEDTNFKNQKTERKGVAFSFINEIYFSNFENSSGKIVIWMSDTYTTQILGDKKRLFIFNRKVLSSIKSYTGKQILLYLSCLSPVIDKVSIAKIKKSIKSDKEFKYFKELIIRIIPKLNNSLKANIVIDEYNNLIFNREKKLIPLKKDIEN